MEKEIVDFLAWFLSLKPEEAEKYLESIEIKDQKEALRRVYINFIRDFGLNRSDENYSEKMKKLLKDRFGSEYLGDGMMQCIIDV
jgi:hypothetical protein